MVSKTNGKPKAAAHGCLTARHWKDIRQAMQLVRHEGVPLTVHGVTVGSTATTTETRGPQKGKTADDSVRDGHKLAPAATADAARAGPSKKQQRDTLRAEENRARTACATRWLPFIYHVLRSDRAKSRGDVWTAHMKHRLALRDKMRDFFVRVWSQTARMRAHEDATTRLRLLLVSERQEVRPRLQCKSQVDQQHLPLEHALYVLGLQDHARPAGGAGPAPPSLSLPRALTARPPTRVDAAHGGEHPTCER